MKKGHYSQIDSAGSSGIRTFNPAKRFAEEVLHPLIKAHNTAKITSRLGSLNDEEAMKLDPQVRMIKRYNSMKERIVLQQALIGEIKATVLLNGRKAEIDMINTLQKRLSYLEDQYDKRSHQILFINGKKMPELSPLFKEIGEYLDEIYVQIQRIMTKNKLLFFGEENEFLENEQLLERIKSENRKI